MIDLVVLRGVTDRGLVHKATGSTWTYVYLVVTRSFP